MALTSEDKDDNVSNETTRLKVAEKELPYPPADGLNAAVITTRAESSILVALLLPLTPLMDKDESEVQIEECTTEAPKRGAREILPPKSEDTTVTDTEPVGAMLVRTLMERRGPSVENKRVVVCLSEKAEAMDRTALPLATGTEAEKDVFNLAAESENQIVSAEEVDAIRATLDVPPTRGPRKSTPRTVTMIVPVVAILTRTAELMT